MCVIWKVILQELFGHEIVSAHLEIQGKTPNVKETGPHPRGHPGKLMLLLFFHVCSALRVIAVSTGERAKKLLQCTIGQMLHDLNTSKSETSAGSARQERSLVMSPASQHSKSLQSPPKWAGKLVPREKCRKVSKIFLTLFDDF